MGITEVFIQVSRVCRLRDLRPGDCRLTMCVTLRVSWAGDGAEAEQGSQRAASCTVQPPGSAALVLLPDSAAEQIKYLIVTMTPRLTSKCSHLKLPYTDKSRKACSQVLLRPSCSRCHRDGRVAWKEAGRAQRDDESRSQSHFCGLASLPRDSLWPNRLFATQFYTLFSGQEYQWSLI